MDAVSSWKAVLNQLGDVHKAAGNNATRTPAAQTPAAAGPFLGGGQELFYTPLSAQQQGTPVDAWHSILTSLTGNAKAAGRHAGATGSPSGSITTSPRAAATAGPGRSRHVDSPGMVRQLFVTAQHGSPNSQGPGSTSSHPMSRRGSSPSLSRYGATAASPNAAAAPHLLDDLRSSPNRGLAKQQDRAAAAVQAQQHYHNSSTLGTTVAIAGLKTGTSSGQPDTHQLADRISNLRASAESVLQTVTAAAAGSPCAGASPRHGSAQQRKGCSGVVNSSSRGSPVQCNQPLPRKLFESPVKAYAHSSSPSQVPTSPLQRLLQSSKPHVRHAAAAAASAGAAQGFTSNRLSMAARQGPLLQHQHQPQPVHHMPDQPLQQQLTGALQKVEALLAGISQVQAAAAGGVGGETKQHMLSSGSGTMSRGNGLSMQAMPQQLAAGQQQQQQHEVLLRTGQSQERQEVLQQLLLQQQQLLQQLVPLITSKAQQPQIMQVRPAATSDMEAEAAAPAPVATVLPLPTGLQQPSTSTPAVTQRQPGELMSITEPAGAAEAPCQNAAAAAQGAPSYSRSASHSHTGSITRSVDGDSCSQASGPGAAGVTAATTAGSVSSRGSTSVSEEAAGVAADAVSSGLGDRQADQQQGSAVGSFLSRSLISRSSSRSSSIGAGGGVGSRSGSRRMRWQRPDVVSSEHSDAAADATVTPDAAAANSLQHNGAAAAGCGNLAAAEAAAGGAVDALQQPAGEAGSPPPELASNGLMSASDDTADAVQAQAAVIAPSQSANSSGSAGGSGSMGSQPGLQQAVRPACAAADRAASTVGSDPTGCTLTSVSASSRYTGSSHAHSSSNGGAHSFSGSNVSDRSSSHFGCVPETQAPASTELPPVTQQSGTPKHHHQQQQQQHQQHANDSNGDGSAVEEQHEPATPAAALPRVHTPGRPAAEVAAELSTPQLVHSAAAVMTVSEAWREESSSTQDRWQQLLAEWSAAEVDTWEAQRLTEPSASSLAGQQHHQDTPQTAAHQLSADDSNQQPAAEPTSWHQQQLQEGQGHLERQEQEQKQHNLMESHMLGAQAAQAQSAPRPQPDGSSGVKGWGGGSPNEPISHSQAVSMAQEHPEQVTFRLLTEPMPSPRRMPVATGSQPTAMRSSEGKAAAGTDAEASEVSLFYAAAQPEPQQAVGQTHTAAHPPSPVWPNTTRKQLFTSSSDVGSSNSSSSSSDLHLAVAAAATPPASQHREVSSASGLQRDIQAAAAVSSERRVLSGCAGVLTEPLAAAACGHVSSTGVQQQMGLDRLNQLMQDLQGLQTQLQGMQPQKPSRVHSHSSTTPGAGAHLSGSAASSGDTADGADDEGRGQLGTAPTPIIQLPASGGGSGSATSRIELLKQRLRDSRAALQAIATPLRTDHAPSSMGDGSATATAVLHAARSPATHPAAAATDAGCTVVSYSQQQQQQAVSLQNFVAAKARAQAASPWGQPAAAVTGLRNGGSTSSVLHANTAAGAFHDNVAATPAAADERAGNHTLAASDWLTSGQWQQYLARSRRGSRASNRQVGEPAGPSSRLYPAGTTATAVAAGGGGGNKGVGGSHSGSAVSSSHVQALVAKWRAAAAAAVAVGSDAEAAPNTAVAWAAPIQQQQPGSLQGLVHQRTAAYTVAQQPTTAPRPSASAAAVSSADSASSQAPSWLGTPPAVDAVGQSTLGSYVNSSSSMLARQATSPIAGLVTPLSLLQSDGGGGSAALSQVRSASTGRSRRSMLGSLAGSGSIRPTPERSNGFSPVLLQYTPESTSLRSSGQQGAVSRGSQVGSGSSMERFMSGSGSGGSQGAKSASSSTPPSTGTLNRWARQGSPTRQLKQLLQSVGQQQARQQAQQQQVTHGSPVAAGLAHSLATIDRTLSRLASPAATASVSSQASATPPAPPAAAVKSQHVGAAASGVRVASGSRSSSSQGGFSKSGDGSRADISPAAVLAATSAAAEAARAGLMAGAAQAAAARSLSPLQRLRRQQEVLARGLTSSISSTPYTSGLGAAAGSPAAGLLGRLGASPGPAYSTVTVRAQPL